MFSESFYVAGMAEYGAAFGDAEALAQAEACFDKMTEWYYHPENDPFKITPKGYAETRDERTAAVHGFVQDMLNFHYFGGILFLSGTPFCRKEVVVLYCE